MANFRRMVWFEGRVQGVGFRYKARQIAAAYDVAGYVKNLDDGRVELCAAGGREEVCEYVEALCESMADFIKKTKILDGETDLKYKGFNIEL
ncbi:MAG: acylphosphatase [Opitutales bacterium]|nr:acylphosphatase [Opitutales bacterium]